MYVFGKRGRFIMSDREDILSKRTGFLFYFDWAKYVERLSTEQAGSLLQAIIRLAMNGEDTDFSDDLALDLAFIGISDTIKRDTEKYIDKARTNRANGANGGRPRKDKDNPQEPTDNPQKPNGYFGFLEETHENPQKPDRDIDTDRDRETDSKIDTDSDRDSDIDIEADIDTEVFHDGSCKKFVYPMFIDKWNTLCTAGINKIKTLTDSQKKSIDNIIINYDFNTLLMVMDNVKNSDYLMGKGKHKGMTIDFFLKMDVFQKIMGGFYDNKE